MLAFGWGPGASPPRAGSRPGSPRPPRAPLKAVPRRRWFCHVDDDNYVNVRALLKLLASYPHTQDIYLGKPSLDRPIQATERVSESKVVSVPPTQAYAERGGLEVSLQPGGEGSGSLTTCPLPQRPVHFWFATGGAGFCISRGLALKMSPWAR